MTNQSPESVIAEVIEYHADAIDTHGPGCYKNHAACLAVKLRDILREPGGRIAVDRAFIRWRDDEIDRTGTLPDGFELFRAGWLRAIAAVNGTHDHIEDGNSYLDCGACDMEREER